ncbi:E3 ubiquitin-protein ligase RNF34-like protein [Dinothrombium tinctorium]|uniref:E3 ubiquitin-protein ligase RNF34-like protein n=1 Tax=Dinothrombium tinctorium TaxID=1965070 RepID=A0A3S4RH39_9ACAR|nr:E3 ubiquitin-protein ligase RNF34-like protein [Dinothrombium tinctorium]RWS16072.1 E3 ubiquitin-protein ligase RNF34-like protein [Dinothrombium tinctorium]RWS16095.1 E3 ubiquitin-protein ligase RNF34-like protein [Dinothrombium tinctorium]
MRNGPHVKAGAQNSRFPQFALNFDFPQFNIPNLNVPNLSETLVSAPQNIARFMSFNSNRNSSNCENCGERFNILVRRKKTCADCRMDFCCDCIARDVRRGEAPRNRCRRCRIFSMRPLDRNALMSLRVRDLKWFLDSRGVSSQFCNEKSELVDLILQQSNDGFHQRTFLNPSSSQSNDDCDNDSNWVFVNRDDIGETSSDVLCSSRRATQRVEEVIEPPNSDIDVNEETKLFNINDLKSEEEIYNLSVRQLKLLLTRNFVDYKGCCEKEELAKKVVRLWRDTQKSEVKDPDTIDDINLCKICMEREINCVLLECGHMVACSDCGKRLSECPICRQYVVRIIRTFKS